MKSKFFAGAFSIGALAVLWVAYGFLGSNHLALTMTFIIAGVYGFGALELRAYQQATASLAAALSAIPEALSSLDEWLSRIHPSLQNPVRLRIEGERVGLPGPAMTPYLVGLLVMLGMLGTFLGMVVTLNGAVFALEGTTDLQAIRSAFAAPIKGLGLSFGTSVAGVAASAMLGLMSAISRRERMLQAQSLDTKIAGVLRGFSLTYQRQETLKALQRQSNALPAVIDQMQAMMVKMETMGLQLNTRLVDNQEGFHREVKVVYTELAHSVDQSLRSSLVQSAEAASESIRPLVLAAVAGMSDEARLHHARMAATTQAQLEGLATRLGASTASATDAWMKSLEAMAVSMQQEWEKTGADISRLMQGSEELVRTRIASEALWSAQHGERMDHLASALRSELGTLRDEEAVRGQAAVQRLGELQTTVTAHLTTLGTALEEPITRLIHTASEAPRAAAEVIGKLREEVSHSAARDNALLEERGRIMATLTTLLDGINHASLEQRAVIDALVASSALTLGHAGSAFADKVDCEAAKLSDVAAHVTSSAIEVSSLSDTLSFAMRSFNEANEKLIANLQRIEGALDKSMARSDDQLAYYVAQAREIIDLSIMSQKEIVDEMRQLPAKPSLMGEEMAA